MPKITNIWDVTPETAHPRARQMLGHSVIWNYGDEDSPLGNDTGADTFAAYLNFRATRPVGGAQDFVREQLALRGIPDTGWDLLDLGLLEEAIKSGAGSTLVRRDDFIIALAFSQLLLEGSLDPEVQRRAITALRRQESDVVVSFRGGGGKAARKQQLMEFTRILELV